MPSALWLWIALCSDPQSRQLAINSILLSVFKVVCDVDELFVVFQEEKGFIYDRKPFRVSVEKYRVYDWCACGMGHMQPFCDGTCKNK